VRERRERERREDAEPAVERPPQPPILALQRSAGNQAVVRMLAREGETAVVDPVAQRQRAETMLIDLSAESGDTHELPSELINPFEAEEGEPSGAETHHMPAAYIRARLADRANNTELDTAFQAAVTTILADWQQFRSEGRWHVVGHARRIVELLIRQFIQDPQASSLDLLGPQLSARYRNFQWHRLDFPGHAEGEAAGPNEGRAREMVRNLNALRPERRANSTGDAVVTETQFSRRRMRQYVDEQATEVPDTGGFRLNRHANEHFVEMRAAALADNVELAPAGGRGSFYRAPEVSQTASAGQNPVAIAGFSAHNLGLAIDLRMSAGTQRYQETTTRPMQNVVDMRQSPVHKWMFIHGARFGFYPYQVEPWHFEYNPPGFPALFMREYDEWVAAQGS
jgi:hypothetical protein